MTALGFPASAHGRGFFLSGEEGRCGDQEKTKQVRPWPNCCREPQLRCWTAIHRNSPQLPGRGGWRA